MQIWSKPYGEYQVRKHWICERCCRPYRGRYCTHCWSKVFPPHYKPLEKYPPKAKSYTREDGSKRYYFDEETDKKYKEWDRWYTEQYMMERIDDPELVYEIYSEELIYRQHQMESYSKMIKQPKRGFGKNYKCRKCKFYSSSGVISLGISDGETPIV